jgi:serine/threonine protein kinase
MYEPVPRRDCYAEGIRTRPTPRPMPAPHAIPAERTTATAATPAPQPVGRVIGLYVLGRCVGRGGMATVYEARHRFLRQRVAIKLLRPEHCGDEQLVRRFCNEARAAAGIEHPGVVRYLDVGRTAEGEAYLVMELLEGESLRQRLMPGPLSEAAAVAIGRQLASALAAAHARGVVHRDIKPENVLLARDPEAPGGERVKVLDFGIAKRTQRADTRPGVVIGTPAYMAPEQCQPGMAVDGRADVYGLGALLYRMVTGRPVFESATDVGLMCQHVHDAPIAPRALGIAIADGFERLLATCLAKRPADRYPSMATLADALAALAAGIDSSAQATVQMLARSAAAPIYPVRDPSPPGGVIAGGTPPPRPRARLTRWTRSPLAPARPAHRRTPRRWAALGGLALGLALIATALLL